MTTLTLTSWNIEHFSRLLDGNAGEAERLAAIAAEIRAIDPHVLLIVEGPASLPALEAWAAAAEPHGLGGGWRVATIPGTEEALEARPDDPRRALAGLYAMQGNRISGGQWLWFLVKDGLFQESRATLLAPLVWQDLTGQRDWPVHRWGELISRRHAHWRHPQVLLLQMGGVEIEVVGAHLKSKINHERAFDEAGELTHDYVDEALRARIQLATEAYDIRRYIDGRFAQTPKPRILVAGDFNDGPGRGFFEREYLYFDLVGNLQGDVFAADKFLNHALFDFPGDLRWTTAFDDRVERWSRTRDGTPPLPAEPYDATRFQLIDHILFTQALVGEGACPRIRGGAGRVEHTVHQRINAGLGRRRTSDHVPVSVELTL
jgi:hypothetical protein